jgi:hypothetical protein
MIRSIQLTIIIILICSCGRKSSNLNDKSFDPFLKTYIKLENIIPDSSYKIVQGYVNNLYKKDTLGIVILKKNCGDTIYLNSIVNKSMIYATSLPFYSIVNNHPLLIELENFNLEIKNNDITNIIDSYLINDLLYREEGEWLVRVNPMIIHEPPFYMIVGAENNDVVIDTVNINISDVFEFNLDHIPERQIINSN